MNMENRQYWEENGNAVKFENYKSNDEFPRGADGQLNFATGGGAGPPSDDDADYPTGAYLKKGKQDPMSHRIIEKRRRDRMNNCLADLSRLIPPEYLKKGRGRVEKTEIIEMAIRHLKFLHERASAAERTAQRATATGADSFRAGWDECAAEAVRYLAEAHGLADGLCAQLASHLQHRCDTFTKGEFDQEKRLSGVGSTTSFSGASCSETASSSGSSRDYVKAPVIATRQSELRNEAASYENCDETASRSAGPAPASTAHNTSYMDCDREGAASEAGAAALRAIRRPELVHTDDYLHSYKFKNSIERRFSRSQDNEAHDMSARHSHGKLYTHKRRRASGKHAPAPPDSGCTSTSTSASVSTEEARDTSPQDSSDSPHTHYANAALPQTHHAAHASTHYVPVFALNALGKYYVPLSVEYGCLARQLGTYDVLAARAAHLAAPLHPVSIHVNFQPCLNYHVKREPADDWPQV